MFARIQWRIQSLINLGQDGQLFMSVFMSQVVGILINGSVPDLTGSRVECEYSPGLSTAATVHLDYGPAQIQTCPLLSREHYQPILPGTGESRRRACA